MTTLMIGFVLGLYAFPVAVWLGLLFFSRRLDEEFEPWRRR